MRNFGVQVNGGAGASGTFEAEEANSLMREGENLVLAGGAVLDDADNFQLAQSVSRHVGAADYYAATGAANAFTLTQLGTFFPPYVLTNGMRVRFISNQNVTGAATITMATIGGAIAFRKKNPNGTDTLVDLIDGDILIGTYVEAIYRETFNAFEAVVFDTISKSGWRTVSINDANYTFTVAEHKTLLVIGTASGGTFNVNLPRITTSPNGLEFMIRKNTTVGLVNVNAFAGDNIGQPPPGAYAATIQLALEGEIMHLIGSGPGNTRWVVANRTAGATLAQVNAGTAGYYPITAEILGTVTRSLTNLTYASTTGGGYQQIPGSPFLMQWGVQNPSAVSSGTAVFPITFNTSVLNIMIMPFNANIVYFRVTATTLLTFSWATNVAITGQFRYLAIGY